MKDNIKLLSEGALEVSGAKIVFKGNAKGSGKLQSKLRGRIIMAFVVLAAFSIVFLTVYRSMASFNASAESLDSVIKAKSFELAEDNYGSITTESVNVTVAGNGWKITGFTNYIVEDKPDEAPTPPPSLIISRETTQSYSSAIEQAKPKFAMPKGAPLAPGNRYAPGNCTWYAYNRRYAIGRPVGQMWGNGGTWHYSAAGAGYRVDHTPEVGAVFEQSGHVAVVEAVGKNNTVYISEMNYGYVLYRYNERWVANARTFWYIH